MKPSIDIFKRRNKADKKVERASKDSFPASDPPAWTGVTGIVSKNPCDTHPRETRNN